MSEIGCRFQRRLTDDEMTAIRAARRQGATGAARATSGFTALWDVILGSAEETTYLEAIDQPRPLSPADFAIPTDQAEELLHVLKGRLDRRTRAAIGVLWFNSGPATYDEA